MTFRINRKYQVVAMLGMAAILAVSVAGCKKSDPNKKVIFTTGPGKTEVFRLGDEICETKEMMVYLTTTQNQYENVYGQEIWNTSLEGVTLEENVKDMVLEKVAQIKSMYMMAKERGVVLDDEEKEKVCSAAKAYVNSLTNAEKKTLDLDQDYIEKMYTEYALANKVYSEIIKDINPEISDDEARIIEVQDIFFQTITKDKNGEKVPVGEAKRKEIYNHAKEVYDMAIDGEHDFTELANKYSDDKRINYSFGKGEMELAFEDAAFALGNGEISQIVAGENGYHIIKCISTFDQTQTDANKLKIVENRRNEAFGSEYDAFVSPLVRRLNDELWNQLSMIREKGIDTQNYFEIYNQYFMEEQ